MAKARPYYASDSLSVAWYDAMTAADRSLDGDAEIYAGLVPPGGSVLELGAGTGRLTADFAAQGLSVTGIDLSPAMLARAEARCASLADDVRARITLRRGDMAALDLRQTFDAVICPFFTLAHVPAGAAWRNTFVVAARHLGQGGRAAFHLPRLDVMRRAGPVAPDRPVMELAGAEGRRLRLFVTARSFREDVGRLEQVIDYVELDAAGRELRRSPERLTYWMTDPTPLAATAGLEPDGPPRALGDVGDVWIFRKAST